MGGKGTRAQSEPHNITNSVTAFAGCWKKEVVKWPKKLVGTLKLQIPAGGANPSPPVGPALGQRGINIMEFCKAFNAKTADMEQGAPCPTIIEYFQDKSFSMEIKTKREKKKKFA